MTVTPVHLRSPGRTVHPAGEERPWALTDLIDVETLQSIQDTFARVFKLPTVIVDREGRNLTQITHRLAFCEDLTRTTPVGGARCAGCDRDAMDTASATLRPEIFRCWNGLYDCAIPIAPKGEVLGYFLCGQVLDSRPDLARFRATAGSLGIPPDEYVAALGDVQVVGLDDYHASVETMHVLAQMIAEQAAAAIDNFLTLQRAIDARSDAAALVAELDGLVESFAEIASQPDHGTTLEAVRRSLDRLVQSDSCSIQLMTPESAQSMERAGLIADVVESGAATIVHPSDDGIARLVAPLVHKGSVHGLAILQRDTAPFTDHERRLVTVVMAAAAVAERASRLNEDLTRRLREEQLLSSLLTELSQRLTLDKALSAVGRVGVSLLGASAAYVHSPGAAHDPKTLLFNLDPEVAERRALQLSTQVDLAVAGGFPVLGEADESPCIVIPFGSDAGPLGFAVFFEPDPAVHDLRVATALGTHAALGLDNARMLEREQEFSRRYLQLSELCTDLLSASGPMDVVDRLASAGPQILGGDVAAIVILDGADSNATVATNSKPELDKFRVPLTTNARLAAVKLSAGSKDRTLFDSWMDEVMVSAAERVSAETYLTEPLVANGEFVGGLMIGWRDRRSHWLSEERRLLGLMAAAAAGSVRRYTSHAATDAALRKRLAELQVLTDLAERVTARSEESTVYAEVTAAFRDLAQLDGAALFIRGAGSSEMVASCGTLPEDFTERLAGAVAGPESDLALDDREGLLMLNVPLDDDLQGILAGWAAAGPDVSPRGALIALGRYAAVAVDNSRLHDQQIDTIDRLRRANEHSARQYEALQRLLTVLRRIGEAALGPGGIGAMVTSLGELIQAPVAATRSDGSVVVSSPPSFQPTMTDPDPSSDHLQVQELPDGRQLVACPARIELETIGWLITVLDRQPGDVDEAILAHGALLTALALLQETTAVEIETRLKGGFLDELFGGDFSSERIRRQALALGFDLDSPGRVLIAEPTVEDVTPHDMKMLLQATVAAVQGAGHEVIATTRGSRVVAVAAGGKERAASVDALVDRLDAGLQGRASWLQPNAVLGTECSEPEDYQASYAAATRGMGLLTAMARRGSTFSFHAPGLEHLLLLSTEPEVLLDFVTRYVDPLDEYDRAHTSELRRTLEIFYESNLNLQAAARSLHIHVSTLRYRLTRAAEILGVDPREAPTRIDVETALRAASVLNSV